MKAKAASLRFHYKLFSKLLFFRTRRSFQQDLPRVRQPVHRPGGIGRAGRGQRRRFDPELLLLKPVVILPRGLSVAEDPFDLRSPHDRLQVRRHDVPDAAVPRADDIAAEDRIPERYVVLQDKLFLLLNAVRLRLPEQPCQQRPETVPFSPFLFFLF